MCKFNRKYGFKFADSFIQRKCEWINEENFKKDTRLFLLNNESDPNVSSNTFKKNLVKDYLLYGQAYAYKNYEIKKIVLGEALLELKELNYLPAQNIQPKVFHNGITHDYAEYTLTTITGQHVGESKKKTFKHNELLRIINNDAGNPFEGEGLLIRGKTVF